MVWFGAVVVVGWGVHLRPFLCTLLLLCLLSTQQCCLALIGSGSGFERCAQPISSSCGSGICHGCLQTVATMWCESTMLETGADSSGCSAQG